LVYQEGPVDMSGKEPAEN
jgi:hypothetical protein